MSQTGAVRRQSRRGLSCFSVLFLRVLAFFFYLSRRRLRSYMSRKPRSLFFARDLADFPGCSKPRLAMRSCKRGVSLLRHARTRLCFAATKLYRLYRIVQVATLLRSDEDVAASDRVGGRSARETFRNPYGSRSVSLACSTLTWSVAATSSPSCYPTRRTFVELLSTCSVELLERTS